MSVERACSGSVVKPIWLFAIMWSVPPVLYPSKRERLNVSATTPCAANAASPWMRIGNTEVVSYVAMRPLRSVWVARACPITTGSTASRWLGFGINVTVIVLPPVVSNRPDEPWWYLTSPVPPLGASVSSTCLPPSNSANNVSYGTPTIWVSTLSLPR